MMRYRYQMITDQGLFKSAGGCKVQLIKTRVRQQLTAAYPVNRQDLSAIQHDTEFGPGLLTSVGTVCTYRWVRVARTMKTLMA